MCYFEQMWQDYVFFVVQLTLALALLPSIYSKEKPHFKTSILMAICLFIITVTNLTLNLWLGAAGTFANVVMWMILAFQKLQKKQR